MDWKNLIADLQHKGLTQKQIAALAGTNQAMISRLSNAEDRRVSWQIGEALRALHQERCATGGPSTSGHKVAA